MRVKTSGHAIHNQRTKTLSLRHRTIFVSKQKGLEIHNFFPQLSDSSRQSIIFGCEELNLGLEICKPLLLTLTTFEGSDTE